MQLNDQRQRAGPTPKRHFMWTFLGSLVGTHASVLRAWQIWRLPDRGVSLKQRSEIIFSVLFERIYSTIRTESIGAGSYNLVDILRLVFHMSNDEKFFTVAALS